MNTEFVTQNLDWCNKHLDKAEMYCSGLEDDRASDMGCSLLMSIRALHSAIEEIRILIETKE